MAVDVEIDVELLKSEIKKTYASVSEEPEKDFIFPTGRAWAEDLGYPEELANVPESAVESFAGVANPWAMGRLAPGERVLDLGSGAGTDSLIAAQMVGEQGHVTGIDMTPEMLAKLERPWRRWGPRTSSSLRARQSGSPSPTRASTS
jgi:arsenite methyltransferase